jgi:hypothetical protein
MTTEKKPEKGASGDRKKKKKLTSKEKPDDRAVPTQDAEDGANSPTSPRKSKGAIAPDETTMRKSRSPKSKKPKSTKTKGEVSPPSSPSKKKRDESLKKKNHAVPPQDAEDGANSPTSPRKAKGVITPDETTVRKSRSPKGKKPKSTKNKGEVSPPSSPSKKKREESPKKKKSPKKKSTKKTVTDISNEAPHTELENSLEELADHVSETPKSAFVLESEKVLASRPIRSRKTPMFSPTNGESVENSKFSGGLFAGLHSGFFRGGIPSGM